MNNCNNKLQLQEHERQLCEIWTRVMGYHRPISEFNLGKQGEFVDRKFFKVPKKEK